MRDFKEYPMNVRTPEEVDTALLLAESRVKKREDCRYVVPGGRPRRANRQSIVNAIMLHFAALDPDQQDAVIGRGTALYNALVEGLPAPEPARPLFGAAEPESPPKKSRRA